LQRSKLCWTATRLREASAIGLHQPVLLQPRERLMENLGCTNIWRHNNPVVHPLPFATGFHDACPPKISEVPGDFRLPLLKDFYEIADANLLVSHQVEQAKASLVTKRLEEQFHVEGRCLSSHS